MSEPENSKLNGINNINNLIISESNYSCQYLDEDFLKQKNIKSKKLYNIEEKERDIYDTQEELSKKMYRLLSFQKRQFNTKYNRLKKQDEFNNYYYSDYNNKINSMLSNYNNYYNNNSILNIISGFNQNWIFPKKINNLSNKSFKEKCDIKSYEKNNINNTKENKYKSKSCSKLIKTYRTNNDNPILNLKKQFNTNNNNINNNINNKYRTERKSKFNSAVKIGDVKSKNRTAKTTVRNSSYKNKNNLTYNYLNSMNNKENILNDNFYKIKNNSRFLTKENFYPKNIFFNLNKDKNKLTFDNGCNSTKTSFRNCRINNNDLNDSKSLRKFESQYNFYNFNSNNQRVALKQIKI